jgi:hypothetical protein
MNVVDTHKKQRVTMFVLIVAALVMVSNGISQLLSIDGIGWAGVSVLDGGRAAYLGIFNDPNDMSLYFVMTLPFAFFLFASTRSVLRYLYLLSAAAILYGVYLSNSRGGLLAVLVLLALWIFLKYGLRKTLVLGALALPVVVFVMSRFRTIDSEEASAFGRLDAWYEGFQMLIANPLFGVGQGAFVDHHFLAAHNSFVLVFAELGLLGYFCWAAFLFFCALSMLVLWNDKIPGSVAEKVDADDKAIAKCLTFSFIGFLVAGFFLSRSYSPILFVFCGLITATFYRAVPAVEAKEFFRFGNYLKPFMSVYFGSIIAIYAVVKVLI